MKLTTIAALGVGVALLMSACSTTSSAGESGKHTDGPILIGMPIGLSGLASGLDGPFLNGAKIAADEINAKGGVLGRQLKIITADTKSDPAQAGTAAQKLIDDGADFILPTVDYDLGGPAARVAQSAGIISLTMAGDTRFGKAGIGDLAFNIGGGGANEGAAAATFAWSKGWKKPYLLEDTSLGYSVTFCKNFAESFAKKAGVKADSIPRDTFKNGDSSVASQVSRLRAKGAAVDAVVLCSYPPGGAAAVKQLRAGGVDQPIVTGVAFDGTFWLSTVPQEDNLYVMGGGVVTGTDPDPARAKVYAAYAKATGAPSTQGAWPLGGYSSIEALAKAITGAKSTSSKAVAAQLETFRNVPLAMGKTTWTPNCHVAVQRQSVAVKIVKGAEQFVDMVTPTDIPNAVC